MVCSRIVMMLSVDDQWCCRACICHGIDWHAIVMPLSCGCPCVCHVVVAVDVVVVVVCVVVVIVRACRSAVAHSADVAALADLLSLLLGVVAHSLIGVFVLLITHNAHATRTQIVDVEDVLRMYRIAEHFLLYAQQTV
jgi:hypothetical protein